MQNLFQNFHRPRMLVRAVRHGLSYYRRDTHLPRLLGRENVSKQTALVAELRDLEHQMDQDRRGGSALYSPARHIEILTALVAEARMA